MILAASPRVWGDSPSEIYYIQFDVRFSDNAVDRSNLLMVPADREFRAENFTSIVVSGSAAPESGGPVRDGETLAKQDALKRLLEEHGLTSVKSAVTSVNNSSRSQEVMTYQGAVRMPVTLLASGYDPAAGRYTVTIRAQFSPIAFPDRWHLLQMRHRVRTWVDHVLSWFSPDPD